MESKRVFFVAQMSRELVRDSRLPNNVIFQGGDDCILGRSRIHCVFFEEVQGDLQWKIGPPLKTNKNCDCWENPPPIFSIGDTRIFIIFKFMVVEFSSQSFVCFFGGVIFINLVSFRSRPTTQDSSH